MDKNQFDLFMNYDNNYNLLVTIHYFKKQQTYDDFFIFIYHKINSLLDLKKKELNSSTLEVFIDLKDYKRKELDYSVIKLLIKNLSEKYPDNLKAIYLKNGSFVLKSIYAIICPFIDKVTRKKIKFIKNI